MASIYSIFENRNGTLWVGTGKNGLFKRENNHWTEIPLLPNEQNLRINHILSSGNNQIWVATNQGLFFVDSTSQNIKLNHILKHESVSTMIQNDLFLFIGTPEFLIKFNKKTYEIKKTPLENKIYVHSLFIDINTNLWVGTSTKLLLYDSNNLIFIEELLPNLKDRFKSIKGNENFVWVATLKNGLFKLNTQDKQIINQINLTNDNKKFIIDNIYLDQFQMWIGTFQNGLLKLNTQSLLFKFENNSENSFYCANSTKYRDIVNVNDSNIWIGSDEGLFKYDFNLKNCQQFKLTKETESLHIQHLYKDKNILWVTHTKGINQFDLDSEKFNDFYIPIEYPSFMFLDKSKELYIATDRSLYHFNNLNKLTNISNHISKNIYFHKYINYSDNYVFATSKGLLKLSKDFQLDYFFNESHELQNYSIDSIFLDEDNYIYVFVKDVGLLQLDIDGNILNTFDETKGLPKKYKVKSIIVKNKIAWLSSINGLLKLDLTSKKLNRFIAKDGTNINQYFSLSKLINNGEIYMSGINGLLHFSPEKIKTIDYSGTIVINNLTLLNKEVELNKPTETGFSINKPINELDQIELGYKDYIIGFEFAALDYADPIRNQYAYRLKGFKDDWVYTDANDRKATYTNLSPGNYTFQVKASNKDGIWSDTPKELKIKVYPAPWLSPWAFFAYFVITIFSIWAYIRYKTIASRKRAEKLEVTVEHRTQEVNRQKKMVESLLDHKNEVFANVTHEFKTPLALILGPLEMFMKNYHGDAENLNMIHRNANRLILMVGQILKLSQAELDKEVIRESQAIHPTLTMLHESFKPLALDKNIELSLDNSHDVNVYATADCLEIVIGNLISNALKYTNIGGSIDIKSVLNDKYISVHVSDTGSGIDSHNLDKIFKRFTRLDSHKSIQGTGIGLSVVKEITEANDGQVHVNSELEKGSEFIVTFPISEIDANLELSQVLVDQLVSNTDSEIAFENNIVIENYIIDEKKITVLIIEDNIDMQAHIGNVLKDRFNCFFADRGKKGIALALKEVPDIVICDVMMPGMDGYQVTRILRHDSRTSHIPIILLTALNTKESRIKGWRENIDVYVSKPFDATELNVQIDNILTIRKLLQKKTNKALKDNDSLTSLELPEQDLKFIEKLKDVISKYYVNEYIQKADIASKMAVSERQLQRKVKALIDENPMDMLREYRLLQATMKLKTGLQVSIVSDECGFSSVSYFGSCFKKKYGITPKQYQNLDKR